MWCRGGIDRPRTRVVHFWRHSAVLTINRGVGHKRDHLFLGREGWPYTVLWKFKVVTFEPVSETGSMPGLMKETGDTLVL